MSTRGILFWGRGKVQINPIFRSVKRLAVVTTVWAIATTNPAFAEFQIQEAGIEKGEVELEYRGAYHWGVPRVTDANENANDLVQSHEIELQMGINDWFLIQVTGGFNQPLHENLQAKLGRDRTGVRPAQT
jgi:hypothetical protein